MKIKCVTKIGLSKSISFVSLLIVVFALFLFKRMPFFFLFVTNWSFILFFVTNFFVSKLLFCSPFFAQKFSPSFLFQSYSFPHSVCLKMRFFTKSATGKILFIVWLGMMERTGSEVRVLRMCKYSMCELSLSVCEFCK